MRNYTIYKSCNACSISMIDEPGPLTVPCYAMPCDSSVPFDKHTPKYSAIINAYAVLFRSHKLSFVNSRVSSQFYSCPYLSPRREEKIIQHRRLYPRCLYPSRLSPFLYLFLFLLLATPYSENTITISQQLNPRRHGHSTMLFLLHSPSPFRPAAISRPAPPESPLAEGSTQARRHL